MGSTNLCPFCRHLVTLGDFPKKLIVNTNDSYIQKYINCPGCRKEISIYLKVRIILDGVVK